MSDYHVNKQTADNVGEGKPGPGRPKGSVNKVTADVREMIIKALRLKGGVKYLVRQADENPKAFLALVGRTIPRDVKLSGPDGGPVAIISAAMTPEQAAEAYAATLRGGAPLLTDEGG
jgi:hypothetical protein